MQSYSCFGEWIGSKFKFIYHLSIYLWRFSYEIQILSANVAWWCFYKNEFGFFINSHVFQSPTCSIIREQIIKKIYKWPHSTLLGPIYFEVKSIPSSLTIFPTNFFCLTNHSIYPILIQRHLTNINTEM